DGERAAAPPSSSQFVTGAEPGGPHLGSHPLSTIRRRERRRDGAGRGIRWCQYDRSAGISLPEAPPPGAYPCPVGIRVVLAEDHYLIREGVRRLIEAEPDLDLVSVCEDYDSLLAA